MYESCSWFCDRHRSNIPLALLRCWFPYNYMGMKGQVPVNDMLVQIRVPFPDGGYVTPMHMSQVILTSQELQEEGKNGKQMCFCDVFPLRDFGLSWKWTFFN